MPSSKTIVPLGVVIAVLTTIVASGEGKPEPARFVGTWYSEAGPVTSVTVLQADGYRVEWIEGPLTYQSECWSVRSDGVYAVGRRVMGKALPFEKPYLLLKNAPTPGDGWKAAVAAAGFADTLSVSVGTRERVSTPAGPFEAKPVVVEGRALRYRRWYAPGVGLVQEEASLSEGDPMNLKKLKARLK
jgi:hypothetical protein